MGRGGIVAYIRKNSSVTRIYANSTALAIYSRVVQHGYSLRACCANRTNSSSSSAMANRCAGVAAREALSCASSTSAKVTGQKGSGLLFGFGWFAICFDFRQLLDIDQILGPSRKAFQLYQVVNGTDPYECTAEIHDDGA